MGATCSHNMEIMEGGYSFITIEPKFTIKDDAAARPIMEEFIEATRSEKGCLYYGWSTSGADKLFCREAYVDAAATLAHLDNVGALVGKITESACTLDEISFHGPAAELEKLKPTTDAFGAKYFAVDAGFGSMKLAEKEEARGKSQTLVQIKPRFTIKDMAAACPIMKEFIEATRGEEGCLYYGWTLEGDATLVCREAYVDAAATLAHLDNVGALVGKITESACALDAIEFHGPAAELEKLKPTTDAFGAVYFEPAGGFINYTHTK